MQVKGSWQATVHGIARVGHDLVTKPPPTIKEKIRNWHLDV